VDEARSWSADIVVVGMRGQGLLRRLLLGSTARSILHHAGASVLVTPATAGSSLRHIASSAVPIDAIHA
jgi:nucleotide-binding universal stress UspA family protein